MRESAAATDLDRLLRPRSIAVLGGGWASNVVEQCLRAGFAGRLYPLHPSKAEVHGVRAYRRLADLPEPPDAAFVAVNREASIDVIAELSAMGAGGAICFAAGFAESVGEIEGGDALQARLLEAAGAMPILGPNCYGLINYLDGATLWPDQHGGRRETRGVALLTQSGNIAINLTMQRRGLPVAYVITCGNQAQRSLTDIARAVIEDPRVTALGLHVEGFGDLHALEALASRARALGKPVAALKVGRSEQAQASTLSHTASLAGSGVGASALLSRLGIGEARSATVLLEALKLLHVHGPLAGGDLCSMSCSGGEAGLIADSVLGRRLRFPSLEAGHKAAVKSTLGPLVTVANPLDYHTFIWGDREKLTATFTAMLAGGFDLSMLILDFPRLDRCTDASWQPTVDAIVSASRTNRAKAAVVALLPENLTEARCDELTAAGVAPLFGIDDALAAAEIAYGIGAAWAAATPAPTLWRPGPAGRTRLLDEAAAKAALAAHGLRTPRRDCADTPEAAARAAEAIGGRVALKGLGVAHKTEAGAVRLGLAGGDAVRAAAEAMAGVANGFLVEEMVEGALAELLIGVTRDPAHGFLLTLGAGGVLTELLADAQTIALPATDAEIETALGRLRLAPLLAGYRGKPAADRGAILAAVRAVTAYAAAEAARLEEVEVNPLIVTAGGATAVDALIRLSEDPT